MILVDGAESARARIPGVDLGCADLEPPGMEGGRAAPHRLVAAQVLELEEHVELREPVLGRAFRISFSLPQPLQGSVGVAHPGANVTGLSAFATEIQGKQLDLVRDVVPRIARIGFLFNMSNPVRQAEWKEAEPLARATGIQAQLIDVRSARNLEAALDNAMKLRIGALIVGVDAVTQANRSLIAQASIKRNLPSMSREREFAEAGGLMSYGVHYPDLYRRAAVYVGKILRGARPADLPVEQPTKFELVINLKTARALGLTISPSLLQRADQVIEYWIGGRSFPALRAASSPRRSPPRGSRRPKSIELASSACGRGLLTIHRSRHSGWDFVRWAISKGRTSFWTSGMRDRTCRRSRVWPRSLFV